MGEDGTGAMWVAPEIVAVLEAVKLPGCTHEVVIEADLQTHGRVAFAWHPETGELSFAADGPTPALTLPADLSAEPLARATRSCGSR